MGRRLRSIGRTIRRRSGEAKAEVLKLTAETGRLLERSVNEARSFAVVARRRARARREREAEGGRALDELADRCEKVAGQIRRRVAGEPIKDRIVSLADPDARPIRKGKLGKPNAFGYVTQICEPTGDTRRGARGLILPASTAIGPAENTLLPETVAELGQLAIRPREVALDGGFQPGPTNQVLGELAPERVYIGGRQEPDSKRTQRRMRRYRTGAEGRISHLKRRYALDRSRLKGATTASGSGLGGRSSPTTPTRSPSGAGETLQDRSATAPNPLTTNGRADHRAAVSPLEGLSAASS